MPAAHDRRPLTLLAQRCASAGRLLGPIVTVASVILGLAACGQRGPLYLPILPPLPATAGAAAPVAGIPNALPTPQSRLLDGTPASVIAAPEVSLPEAGATTMPPPIQAVPANTPAAGTSDGVTSHPVDVVPTSTNGAPAAQ